MFGRLKRALDRRLDNMSQDAKFWWGMSLGTSSSIPGLGCLFAVLLNLIWGWSWWLVAGVMVVMLALAVALWKLADYVSKDVSFGWEWP